MPGKFLDLPKFDYYVAPKGKYDYSKRSPEQLVNDVNTLNDFTRQLVQEKNVITRNLLIAQRRLDVAGWKLWTLGIVVAGEGTVIGWLVRAFLSAHTR